MVVKEYDSPCGLLYMASIGGELCLCSWQGLSACYGIFEEADKPSGGSGTTDYKSEWDVLERAVNELDEYFAGERKKFDIPLRLYGTDFQNRVWSELLKIPYGQTRSYSTVARIIGSPRAVRAVANACARNPLSIFVPCHRVVSRIGKLTGYAGGLEAKRMLLDIERGVAIPEVEVG